MTEKVPVLFVDSNVLIEAVFIPLSAAAIITDLVAIGAFDMVTCALPEEDAERAMLNKVLNEDELDIFVRRWTDLKRKIRLQILPDPSLQEVKEAYTKYIGVMRHKADIPILTAAISCKPTPFIVLSNNREHFNDLVAAKSGVKMA